MTGSYSTSLIRTAIGYCLPCASSGVRASSPDLDEQQQHAHRTGRRPFARDELEGLLAFHSSDEDAGDTLSLHSDFGGARQSKTKRRSRHSKQDGWGVPGRGKANRQNKVVQILGWYPFGMSKARAAAADGLGSSTLGTPTRRPRAGSVLSTSVPDAAPLDSSTIAQLGFADEQVRKLARRQFEPSMTTAELEREEREERLANVQATRTAQATRPGKLDMDPSLVPPLDSADSSSRADEHAKRLRRAAREQRRRMKEEAKRLAHEDLERRADAAAGFGDDEGDFGEFVTFRPEQASTEDTLSEITSSQLTPEVTQVDEEDDEDDQDLMDYGAEYGQDRRKSSSSVGGSDRARSAAGGAVERMSGSSNSSSKRVARPSLPPSSIDNTKSNRASSSQQIRGTRHSRTLSKSSSSLSSTSGKKQDEGGNLTQRRLTSIGAFNGPLGGLDERRVAATLAEAPSEDEGFDGVPGGL